MGISDSINNADEKTELPILTTWVYETREKLSCSLIWPAKCFAPVLEKDVIGIPGEAG